MTYNKIPLPDLGLDCEKKELKDCPFCGGKPCNSANNYETPSGRDYIVKHFVECMNCEGRTKEYDTEKQANQSWNTRTAENEKIVLFIDEEKLAIQICLGENPNRDIKYWEKLPNITKTMFRQQANRQSQNAKSFMRIEKE